MADPSRDRVYLGIDVGTGSARAGVFDAAGRMLAVGTREIEIWRPQADFVEQSSDDIWQSVCGAVAQVLRDAAVEPARIRGVGFDATCSLVVLGADGQPVTVSPSGRDEQNVIVWMDHRALEQAQRVNATGHEVLKYVGGRISPEMETPKLLWLKENLPQTWQRAARFLDLPDFLVYRATGEDVRSLCSTVCKWTYLGHRGETAGGWEPTYFRQVGLGDLVDERYRRIGTRVRPVGEAVGHGLAPKAARELGLEPGTAVGVSIIDAHAGGLGMLAAPLDGRPPSAEALETRLALIGGTSSCHMAVSQAARFIPGVWGPYFSAMVPDMWLTEGGQSATGALIDHVIFTHARAAALQDTAGAQGRTVYGLLNGRLEHLGKAARFPAELTRELHVLPYFHGNRSPRADATLRGVISGLTLGETVDDLAMLYLATVQAVAHGTRHIIDTLNENGYRIATIFACGGGTKNPVFLREHADITGCRIVLPREPEAVLLGAAILGAVAAGDFGSVLDAMKSLNHAGEVLEPAGGAVAEYHGAKHTVFLRMYDAFMAQREIMARVRPA
ncbi:MAG: FGGY-family carbohydrate kinase [Phycisphaerae bacterium]|nr:FGGY-family carbohydrate kinase [Phycisphaerae bacterium]